MAAPHEKFNGYVYVLDRRGQKITITLDGDSSNIKLGGNGKGGEISLQDPSDRETIRFHGGHAYAALGGSGKDGNVHIHNRDGQATIHLDGKNGNITAGGEGVDGDLFLHDSQDRQRVHIDSDLGNIYIYNDYNNTSEKKKRIRIMGQSGNIDCGGGDEDGDLILRDADGNGIIRIDAGKQSIYIKNADGTKVMELGRNGNICAGGGGKDGDLILRTGGDPPRDRIVLDANSANIWMGGNDADGDIVLFPKDATNRGAESNLEEATIHLDGDAGDIKLLGADCAEYFPVAEPNEIEIDPGAVLVAGQESSLALCKEAYDKRVVGVISGAGDLKPGIVLNKKVGNKKSAPVAMAGTVFCKVDAQCAEIEVGDLLTTSPTPGHAMKAVDSDKAFGTVLGKALGSLETGQGLIPIVVTLR